MSNKFPALLGLALSIVLVLFFYFFTFFQTEDKEVVNLYYYNAGKDIDSFGNLRCSPQGLEELKRSIPSSDTLIEDTLQLLLQGNLTEEEKDKGIGTEYPLPGFALIDTELSQGILTLSFQDSENKTNGGACRTGILWFQIEATAKQFPQVNEVRFKPEWLFQP